jgi:hypothetical protein
VGDLSGKRVRQNERIEVDIYTGVLNKADRLQPLATSFRIAPDLRMRESINERIEVDAHRRFGYCVPNKEYSVDPFIFNS